ncbi:MAG: hypothetical protein JWO44_1592 [Bacteroidetes bacterium]|nr:hypothetical protein [Bacteroidota bacterium]
MNLKKYVLLSICFMAAIFTTLAQPAGWLHTLPVTVTNNTGSAVYNYQLQLTVNTQTPVTNGEMQASGADIRFGKNCAGTTLFSYWIESGMNTASTVIWVKIDTLPANGTIPLYMFYGNPVAGSLSSIPSVFVGPNSATDSVSGANTGGVGDSQRGFRFSSNQDILVTDFGKNEPTGSTRYITLFDFTTQAILRQAQVTGPAAQYDYSNIGNPIWLTQGTQYLVEIFQASADGYYFGAAPQAGAEITYYDMRYCNGCSQNSFPTNTLGGMHYGYVDFWYYTKTTLSSAPTVSVGFPVTLNTTASGAQTICSGSATTLSAMGVSGGTLGWYSASTGGTYLGGGSSFTTPVLTSGTTYYVQDSTSCGTGSRTSIPVTVTPLPPVAITGAAAICSGGSTVLTAAGADTYSWNTGSTTDTIHVMPAMTTDYVVSGTDATSGCIAMDTVTLTVNPLPALTIGGANQVCTGSSTLLTAMGADTYMWNGGPSTDTMTVMPTVDTDYYVTGMTTATGCMNMDTVTVTVNPLPSVMVAGTATVCSGTSTTLTATGADSYAWSGGPATDTYTVTPLTASTYTVTGTITATGCTNTVTQTVTVNALPPVTAAASDSVICEGQTITLTAGGADSYSWMSGPATAAYTVSPLTTETYTVTGTSSADGCSDTATITITVNVCTGIADASSANTLDVYPQPSKGDFVIGTSLSGVFTISNQLGQVVKTFTIEGTTRRQVAVSGLPSGIYYLSGTDNGRIIVRKKIIITN